MKNVLIVDDLAPYIEKEKTILQRADFKIFTATSGQEAIEIHTAEKMDLILADIDMPGMNGDEMCRVIRSRESLRKVSIILVCLGRKSDVDRCLSSGANDYITKPIDPRLLIGKVTQFLNIPERKHLRVLTKVSFTGKIKSESFFGTTQDISISGILLETDRVLAKGDVITCSFFIPDADRIEVLGEIMRVSKTTGSLNHYGVRFGDLSLSVKSAIESFIRKRSRH